jgi:hypothetical protein
MVLAVLMLLNVVPFSTGAPINPSTVWGDIYIGGANQTVATHDMTVWIDGVAYGSDTSSGPGTWLTVYMVCAGDDISYNEKSGGLNGDMMYYTMDDMGPYIANEVFTFTSGATTANQHFNYNAGEQPVWGKINEIVNDNAGEDYVYLYFPSAPTLADYRLSDYNGVYGTLDSLTVTQMSVWGENNMYYVDLTGINGGIATTGTLLLEWAGTTTAAGNWVVIDRVEFGHTAITSPGPENTIHPDYGTIVAGASAIRTTNGTADTDDSSVDFTQNLPNPTPIPPAGGDTNHPKNLWVERDFGNNDNILHWNVNGSTTFDVFATNDKSVWNFGAPLAAGVTMPYTHAGALKDGNDWYYVVETTGLDIHTNVAYEIEVAYDYDAARGNTMFISVPWNTTHITTALELALDINEFAVPGPAGLPNCNGVSKWNTATQAGTGYSYVFPIGWLGTNFALEPGWGYFVTLKRDFTWYINGTDHGVASPSYDYDAARGNTQFFSPAYDGVYVNALDLALDVNAYAVPGPAGLPNCNGVSKWNVATQAGTGYSYVFPIGWLGTNFAVDPGVGCFMTLKQDFTWTSTPVSP